MHVYGNELKENSLVFGLTVNPISQVREQEYFCWITCCWLSLKSAKVIIAAGTNGLSVHGTKSKPNQVVLGQCASANNCKGASGKLAKRSVVVKVFP